MPRRQPLMSDTRNSTRKITKSTLAMLAASPARLAKPSSAAISAMTRNVSVQLS